MEHMSKTLLLWVALFCCGTGAFAQPRDFQPSPSAGPTGVLVQTKFGGQIFGFDIDRSGTEGILAESQNISNGNVLAAVETFDQTTGKILKVVARTETKDDYVAMGVVGSSVGSWSASTCREYTW